MGENYEPQHIDAPGVCVRDCGCIWCHKVRAARRSMIEVGWDGLDKYEQEVLLSSH